MTREEAIEALRDTKELGGWFTFSESLSIMCEDEDDPKNKPPYRWYIFRNGYDTKDGLTDTELDNGIIYLLEEEAIQLLILSNWSLTECKIEENQLIPIKVIGNKS